MKYLKQFIIIIAISFIGEILKMIIPLPVPPSIYGMIILFILLQTGILKLSSVKETGKLLIEIMPIMFIPAGVGLITSWELLRPLLIPIGFITIVSLILVMVLSGRITQRVIRSNKSTKGENDL